MDREIPKEEIARKKRKKIAGTAVVFIAVAALVAGLSTLLRPSVKRSDLTIATVDRGTIQSSVSAGGKVVPAFEEIINSPIATRILEVYGKAGDSVDVGTPLLKLDLQSAETELNKLMDQIEMRRCELEQQRVNNSTRLSDLEMQVKVKAMAVDRMEVELRNERYLDSLGSGTGDRVKQVELAYNTGMLELEQMRRLLQNEEKVTDANLHMKELELNITGKNLAMMRRTLDDAQIRSPRRATLTYINNQVGQKVGEGERIAIIADLSHFRVDGEIADAYGDRVTVGGDAVVRIGRDRLAGKVTNVTPQSSNGVIAFTVKLDDDANPRLRSGQKTDVYVMTDVMEDVVRVPNGTFYSGPGEQEVFVLDGDDTLVRRKVTFGESSYEWVEVVKGLQPGERLVVSDMKDRKNSKKLKIK